MAHNMCFDRLVVSRANNARTSITTPAIAAACQVAWYTHLSTSSHEKGMNHYSFFLAF
jgi:hypothetical protein